MIANCVCVCVTFVFLRVAFAIACYGVDVCRVSALCVYCVLCFLLTTVCLRVTCLRSRFALVVFTRLFTCCVVVRVLCVSYVLRLRFVFLFSDLYVLVLLLRMRSCLRFTFMLCGPFVAYVYVYTLRLLLTYDVAFYVYMYSPHACLRVMFMYYVCAYTLSLWSRFMFLFYVNCSRFRARGAILFLRYVYVYVSNACFTFYVYVSDACLTFNFACCVSVYVLCIHGTFYACFLLLCFAFLATHYDYAYVSVFFKFMITIHVYVCVHAYVLRAFVRPTLMFTSHVYKVCLCLCFL